MQGSKEKSDDFSKTLISNTLQPQFKTVE